MPSCKLTKSAIDRIEAAHTAQIWWDPDLKGFGLKVTPEGRKVFLVQYRARGSLGNPKKYTIGPYGPVTPNGARAEAQRILLARAMGNDPQSERMAQRKQSRDETVAATVQAFLEQHASQNRSASETRRVFDKDVLPLWGRRPIAKVTKRDVNELLDGIRARGSHIMANRVLATVRKFFNWSVSKGLIERSPCEGISAPTREHSRDRVLSDTELARVLSAAKNISFPFGPMVTFLALTAQRREEVGGLEWTHLNEDFTEWTIPRELTKNNKAHVVHLSDPAQAVLRSLPRIGRLAFSLSPTSPFQGHSKAKRRLDELSGVFGWRLHDLRRTAVSGMARLGVPPHVADKILNHQSGAISGVAAVYQRHQFTSERAEALALWGRHVEGALRGQV